MKIMKTSRKQKLLAILVALSMAVPPSYAQVTIGAGFEPLGGAILDLKENDSNGDVTATKGMMLPRVNLTNLTDITADITGVTATENLKYTGLTVYNVNKCVSTLAGTGVYVWSGTEWQPLAPLAPGVQKHAAKPGVYEEFYSAEFGTAGRWMTTNLVAWKYDGNKHSTDTDPSNPATGGSGTPRTLEGPNANISGGNSTAYWCYPGNISGSTDLGMTDPMAYNNNPHIGLLYTWDAATAGKGGADGMGSAIDEGTYEETTEIAAGKQLRIQGICPAGWHLPSDLEWTELEKYIYEHAEDFSSYTQAQREAFPNNGVWDPAWSLNSVQYRPTEYPLGGHGTAMRLGCGDVSDLADGLGNSLVMGGFGALLTGQSWVGFDMMYGERGMYWTSSTGSGAGAWHRYLIRDWDLVWRGVARREGLEAVRCKKDN
jgi:hypothetical protein